MFLTARFGPHVLEHVLIGELVPTLSAILPNFNHAEHLPRVIDEIVHQTRPPDEFLILDDASTDNSVQIIEEHAARYPVIRVIRNETNTGVIEANRRLFEAASGDYVYGGAADDGRFPQFFARAMEMAVKHPHAGLICGKMVCVDEADQQLAEISIRRWQQAGFHSPDEVQQDYFDVEAPSHSLCGATIYRRDALAEAGWYQPELKWWGDTFSARAIALKYGMAYVPEQFSSWRRVAGAFSDASRTDQAETLDVIEKAARLMASERFRTVFPAEHIASWRKRYRHLAYWNAWWGSGIPFRPKHLATWLRAFTRIPQFARVAKLMLKSQ